LDGQAKERSVAVVLVDEALVVPTSDHVVVPGRLVTRLVRHESDGTQPCVTCLCRSHSRRRFVTLRSRWQPPDVARFDKPLITSPDNPRVKEVLRLRKSRER